MQGRLTTDQACSRHIRPKLKPLVAFLLTVTTLGCSPIGPSSDSSGRLVFFSQVETRNLQLFASNADGSGVERLVDDLADYTGPDWSPDGTQIVFASTRGGQANFDLYLMNADGSNARRIYGTEFAEFAPSWSPDGTRIAFQFETSPQSGWDIYTIKTDGTDLQRITDSAMEEELPDWSPGGRIAYEAGRGNAHDIFVVDADGTDRQQLTNNLGRVSGAPAWSPDGNQIAFNSTVHQTAETHTDRGEYEIYTMRSDGTSLTRHTHLSSPTRALRYPTGSPDGHTIVAFRRRIYVLNLVEGTTSEVETGRNARYPRFSPIP